MSEESEVIVDWTVFSRTRSELGPGFVRILGYFREDGEQAVARIEQAMQRKEAAGLVTPAHRLKTEALQFGAEALGDMAEEIEFVARRSLEMRLIPDELVPAVAALRPLYERTMELFEKETNPLVERRGAHVAHGANNQEFGRL